MYSLVVYVTIRLQVNSRLLGVKFRGSQKLSMDFQVFGNMLFRITVEASHEIIHESGS